MLHQQQHREEAERATSPPELAETKPFHLRTATRLLNMIMRSIAAASAAEAEEDRCLGQPTVEQEVSGLHRARGRKRKEREKIEGKRERAQSQEV